jgi:tetratricopeptide (TPR) repeat protein
VRVGRRLGSGSVAARLARTVAMAAVAAVAAAALASVPAGDALVVAGRYAEAMDAYSEVLERDPDDARAHYRLARAAAYRADVLPDDRAAEAVALLELAAEHATRATRLAPEDPDAHFELSRALAGLVEHRGVLSALNLAARVRALIDRTLELDPNHANAWHARALYHHHVPWIAGGRAGLVVPSFERAIAIESDVLSLRESYAEVLLERGDRAGAIAQLEVAVRLTPQTHREQQVLEEARVLLQDLR